MLFWPQKYIRLETSLKKEEIFRILNESTDQDQKSIYWGKRFYKKFWGKVTQDAFQIRPVVPYWNISPVEMQGTISDAKEDVNAIDIKMKCPYMRLVLPLAIIAVVLFFINFGLKDQMDVFLTSSLVILASAYLFVNIPFQIQATWSIKTLSTKIKGKIQMLR